MNYLSNKYLKVLLIGLIIFTSCKSNNSSEIFTDFQIIKDNIRDLDTSFNCIYTVNFIDSIPDAIDESIILLDSLKNLDFEVIDYGSGNWEKGPVIITTKLTNYKCNCIINKYYYWAVDGKYRVEERVKCYKLKL